MIIVFDFNKTKIINILLINIMDKTSINVFEVKVVRKDIGFKISAADVMNDRIYLGDEKGFVYAFPIRVADFDVIPKT